MGVTRTELFTREQNDLARMAKVLAHPARIAILQHLARIDTCINGDLVEEIGLAQPTISQHLRELKDVGLIQGTIDGVTVNYCIDPNRWTEVRALLNDLFDHFPTTDRNECC